MNMKMNMKSVLVAGCLAWAGISLESLAAAGGLQDSAERVIGELALAVEEQFGSTSDGVGTSVSKALKQADDAFSRAAEVGRKVASRFRDGGSPRTFVLRGESMTSDVADQLSEDLAVMSRILEQAGGREGDATWTFLGARWGGLGGRDLDALYLEGFGVLFLMNVDFPLVAPEPKKAEKVADVKDPVWEATRKELQGRGRENGGRLFWEARGIEAAQEYDAARVEALTRRVTEALRHASNLRGLESKDWVVVSVFAPEAPTVKSVAFSPDGTKLAVSGGEGAVRVWDVSSGEPVTSTRKRNAVMTFRVRKGDIDAFASGKITSEAFGSRVAVSVR